MKRSHLIAIGAVVAVGAAFALAVRGDRRGEVVRDPVEQARAQALAQRDEALANVNAAHEEMTKRAAIAADALAHRLAGPRPGAPGPLFDAIHFGSAGLSGAIADTTRISDEATRAGVGVGIEPQQLTARVPAAVADAMYRVWNDPPPGRELHDAATHTTLHVRVEHDQTVFAWRPYETLAHLIDPGDGRPPGSTPLSIVGQPLGDVSLALGNHLMRPGADHPNEYAWSLPESEVGPVTAEVEVDHDIVTRVTLELWTSPDDVAAALRKAYGDAGATGLGPWRHGALTITLDGHPPDGATVTATRAPR